MTKLTKTQWLRIAIAGCGLMALVLTQIMSGHFDFIALVNNANFRDLVDAAGFTAIVSQIIPRIGDTAPHKLEQKVEARVQEVVKASVPPRQET